MFLDANVQLSAAQAITVTANSTNIYDVTGAGSGNPPAMIGGVTATGNALIGFDIGAGDGIAMPEVIYNIGTTFVGGTSLQISVQAAPDNGSNAPGTYVTLDSTQVFLTAALISGLNGSIKIPPVPSNWGEALPRFYRLSYTVVGTYSAGTINANIVLNPANASAIQKYPSNYVA